MAGDAPMVDIVATLTRWRTLSRALSDGTLPAGPDVLVVASFTAQPIAPALGVGLADAIGAVPGIRFADYNQLFQVCLDPAAHDADDADEIVVLWRIEDVFERDFHAWANRDADALPRLLDGARSLGAAVAGLARDRTVLATDAPVPVGYGLDHDDPELLTRLAALQAQANAAFDAGLGDARVERVRVAACQLAAGTRATFDRRTWLMYRQPFTAEFAHRVGDEVAAVVAARTRVPPKVLVLDCDGTLWDGIAADDGIGGLDCSDAFPGFAFRSFQRAVQRLRHDGVMLGITSKNDPDTVTRAFAELDGMVLTDDDIAARRVSWEPKPPQVAELVAELNVGLDSVVFVDDSDFEVGAMRTQLPTVRTLQVPADIEALPDVLAETGWFRRMRVTDDDRERTARMIAEAQRSAESTTMSQDEFLASLGLQVELSVAAASDVGRVTQLINKTNQFNVTTVRRGEPEVSALLDDPTVEVFAAAVHDRFGEYGTIGVVIARQHADAGWEIDTLLMSCRVLGRGVETAILAGVVDHLRARRPGPVVGRYLDSGRNHLVAELFPAHGFAPTGEPGVWELPADRPVEPPTHVTLIRP
jgi:FkbH-like protein